MKISIVCKNDLDSLTDMSRPELLLPVSRPEHSAQTLLAQVRESKSFLLCHCVNPPAKMFVRYAYSSFHIVNHAIDGIHSTSCPLHTDVKGSIDHRGHQSDGQEKESFRLHEKLTPAPETTPSISTEVPQSISKAPCVHESKLSQLFNLLCKSTLANWHFPNKSNSPNQPLFSPKNQNKKINNFYLFFEYT